VTPESGPAGQDDFFDTPETKKLSRWVVGDVCAVTLVVVALPVIWLSPAGSGLVATHGQRCREQP
jgi:hypothetical protein